MDNITAADYAELVKEFMDGGLTPAIVRKRTFSAYWTRKIGGRKKAVAPAPVATETPAETPAVPA